MLPFPSRWRTRSVVYHPLEQGKSEEESATGPSPPASVQCLFDHSSSNVWAVTAGVFMAMTVVLGCLLYTQSVAIGSGHNYEHGFSTELEKAIAAAKSAIEIVEVKFTGELAVDEETGTWHRRNETIPQYVGPPNDAIDRAWFDLYHAINLDLGKDESQGVEETFVWPGTQMHYTGLTVHHSLHCVNMLRMAVYRDYYLFPQNADQVEFTWIHLDHCLDFLRQIIQCQGDLTPMTWYWASSVNQKVLRSEVPHTCRDWDSIQKWANERVHVPTEDEVSKEPPRPAHGTWIPLPTELS